MASMLNTSGLLARGGFYVTAFFFILANIADQAGLQFYDALLPEVSTEQNRGRIGGIGVAVGYFGSYLAVGLGLALSHQFGRVNKPLYFFLVALLFLFFASPCFVFVKERGNPRPRPINLKMVRQSMRKTIQTFRSGTEYPGLVRFLIGRVFYTDAINTVISVMSLYTVNVAMQSGLAQPNGRLRSLSPGTAPNKAGPGDTRSFHAKTRPFLQTKTRFSSGNLQLLPRAIAES